MKYDVIVIGGGQSGLAVGYYLRRTGLSFLILDAEPQAGGAWQHYWESLRLFSPAQWSSLPGVIMPGGSDYYPTRQETLTYLQNYETKYRLSVKRPVKVIRVMKEHGQYIIETDRETFRSSVVVAATGSFNNPVIPVMEGRESFRGRVLHSSHYVIPDEFKNQLVAVVGEGNSGAQILAEVSNVASTIWITQKEPHFLPDHVDGRFLFDAASQMYQAKLQGKAYQPPSLGDVVMVPSVKEARDRGVLNNSLRPFRKFTSEGLKWSDGREEKVDVVIFCTGFRPSIDYLAPLQVITLEGRVKTKETKAIDVDGLWMVGFGNWTGFASATLIGVGRSAKATVDQIVAYLSSTVNESSIHSKDTTPLYD